MIQVENKEKITPICKKCGLKFSTFQMLEKHYKRKIPCDRKLKCEKCNKEFKLKANLIRHQNRKTPCEPMLHGNPSTKVGPETCIYCRKVFKSKYTVKKHYNICKIKNGGMEILFEEVKRLKEENKRILKELEKRPVGQHIETQNNIENLNHFNTNININFMNFSDTDTVIKQIMDKNALAILSKKIQQDLPLAKQISDRIVNLVGLAFRNPDHKELQGVYVLDLSKTKENAYYHENGDWVLANWTDLRARLLQKLYNALAISKENKKQDILNIIKYLFVLGDCGDLNGIKRLSQDETVGIYKKIATEMKFSTINTLLV